MGRSHRDKAAIPAGANFEEAFVRLTGKAGMGEEDAEHWARVLTAEKGTQVVLEIEMVRRG
jgi:hypothetical protein